jgi:hypothetical protein
MQMLSVYTLLCSVTGLRNGNFYNLTGLCDLFRDVPSQLELQL